MSQTKGREVDESRRGDRRAREFQARGVVNKKGRGREGKLAEEKEGGREREK